ncbi:cytochrome c [Sedimenticola selenatireducens]|uniref:Cytochrome c n=1 Tax=Sedimenticola selenatireducens TaxID=191960 RepID=A0A557SHQ7_9GAMM|nr:cytochrome c [Sedimenticola selenatireducens]TVO76930.1 cytochrome c [Sedimenticola selenatireducens]TVT64373.1 MAG: cytochrome c [Sedimenticola selenatireducens]
MNKLLTYLIPVTVLFMAPTVQSEPDQRIQLDLPEPMQTHLLASMRQHLVVIDQLLGMLAREDFDKAADLAERELGMSSLDKHGASHIAKYYPKQSAQFGTNMHKAASRFARVAQEGDALAAYKALGEITQNCVGCHATAKVR